jgi:hypothetical protein
MFAYVITTGDYNEYRIDSVYTDKVKAETHLALLTNAHYEGYARIEEFPADQEDAFLAYAVYLNWVRKVDDRGRNKGYERDVPPVLTHDNHAEVVRFLPEVKLHIDPRFPNVYTGSAWGYSYEDATERLYAAIREAEANKE